MKFSSKTIAAILLLSYLSSSSIIQPPIPQFPEPQPIPLTSDQPATPLQQDQKPPSQVQLAHQQLLDSYLKGSTDSNVDNGKDNTINGVSNVIEKGDKNNINGKKNLLNGDKNDVNGDGNVVNGGNNYIQGSGNVVIDGPFNGKMPTIPNKPAVQQLPKSQKKTSAVTVNQQKQLEQKRIRQSNAKLSKGESSIYICLLLLLLSFVLL